jgi:hypothetical protein
MPREIVWASPEHDTVCALSHHPLRLPDDYEVQLTIGDVVVAVRVFSTRQEALAETERMRRRMVEPDR